MTTQRSRREFIRDIGIAAAAEPFIGNLPSIGLGQSTSGANNGSSIMFSPNGVVQNNFLARRRGESGGHDAERKPESARTVQEPTC